MHYDISFPNLGIYLEHVGKSISIFGFEIAYYGIIIGSAMLIGFLWAFHDAKKTGQNPDDYLDLGLAGIICGIVGARIYYVVFSWDMYKDNILNVFNLREGGLAIYGGVIGAVIAVLIGVKMKRMKVGVVFDMMAVLILNGQMLGRWGNFFNREVFGDYTDSLLAMRLPLDAVRPQDVSDLMRQHMVEIEGVSYIQVEPTFLYESLWCAALMIFLVAYRRHKKYDGEIFLLYMFGYGLGRFWIEGIRTDQLLLPGIGFPVSQLLAAVIVVVTTAAMILIRMRKRKDVRHNGEEHQEEHGEERDEERDEEQGEKQGDK